jgi:branched-chain amino acid transport system ATP-binding protein
MTAQPILEVVGVTKRFRGLVAINDVSLAVPEGAICSLIGPNGAGKSTLFNLVTGYLPVTQGEIRYRGAAITHLATPRIAALGIARAFQIARPFRDLSVIDNIRIGALFGRSGARDVAATTRNALELAGLAEHAERPALSLTIGNLRRLEIARAVATRPALLLADEPCAGLNPAETAGMIAVLREVRRQGVTVLLVEHDMPAVMEVSDHVFVLDAGMKIAEGTPEEVTNDKRVVAAYLGTPVDPATGEGMPGF